MQKKSGHLKFKVRTQRVYCQPDDDAQFWGSPPNLVHVIKQLQKDNIHLAQTVHQA